MRHIDLFSGIGGFALAVDTVWPNSEHIFCDNDPFCQQVLKKHWPNSKIYGDIRNLRYNKYNKWHGNNGAEIEDNNSSAPISWNSTKQEIRTLTNSEEFGLERFGQERQEQVEFNGEGEIFLLTGGFPCQPFSQAGRRQGTADDRYLWPEMFRVIREFKPTWVIAENVRGLLTWNEGLVLEQVCADLEGEGYEVQPLIIPAVAVNAPHRRDRVWFIAHSPSWWERSGKSERDRQGESETETGNGDSHVTNAADDGFYGAKNRESSNQGNDGDTTRQEEFRQPQRGYTLRPEVADWNKNWLEVAAELCGIYDGLPAELDGFKLSKAGHRRERLKSLGNAIVPQVAIEIMRAINPPISKE